MKRFQVNEKELNFLDEMIVYIQHDNEVSDQGLGEIKEVFDRIRSRPVVQTVIDPELFKIDHHNDYPQKEEEMTTENEVQEVPTVEAYMSYVQNDDRDGAQAYLVKHFGEDGADNNEGLQEFSKAVLSATEASVKGDLEEAAVAESTDVEPAAEEVEAVAEVMAEAEATTEA